MAHTNTISKFGLNEISKKQNLLKDGSEYGHHIAVKTAYLRAKKYGFTFKDALAEYFESEIDHELHHNSI